MKNYNYPEKRFTVKCSICGSDFTVSYNTYRQKRNDRIWRCPSCMKKFRAKNVNDRINNDPQEREKLNNARINYINSLSDEEKAKRLEHMLNRQKEWYNGLSEEEKAQIRKNSSDKMKKRWDDKSDEEKQKFSEMSKRYWNSLSEKEKKKRREQIKTIWVSMNEDERKAVIEKLKNAHRSIPPDEKEKMRKHLSEVHKKRWENLSEEEKKAYSIRAQKSYNNGYSRWYQNLSTEEKNNFIKSHLSVASSSNVLINKFVEYFNSSIISNNYRIEIEYPISNEHGTKSWDCAIFNKESNELVGIVDLDGAYFHGDNCDYDGMHSKEEYDERRPEFIPKGVKYFIIPEKEFTKSFNLMIKELMIDYDEYISQIFKMCRSMSFPYPKYSDKELIRSYQNLLKMNCDDIHHQSISLNTRLGDRLINHFHESIYHAYRKGHVSPYQAWYSDDLLRKCIENRSIYQTYLNPNKIVQGFNISKIAPRVSVFSAGRAKMIINRYLSEYHQIFDPFSGFSGRMLGAISLGKSYIGQDINPIHVRESNEMIQFLQKYFEFDVRISIDNTLTSSGEYECLFTCPPYGDKEIWIGDESSQLSCDDWIELCLNNFKCKRYVFIVDHTEKYQSYVVDVIDNRSHMNRNKEYVIML